MANLKAGKVNAAGVRHATLPRSNMSNKQAPPVTQVTPKRADQAFASDRSSAGLGLLRKVMRERAMKVK